MSKTSPEAATPVRSLRLPRADDWHIHLREGDALPYTLAHASLNFRRLLAMPNLSQPVTTVAAAQAYHRSIEAAMPSGADCQVLIPLYLTDDTSAAEIQAAAASPLLCGGKLYPAGATTRSDAGVCAPEHFDPVLEAMEKADLPLQVHAEVTDSDVDVFDREAAFVDRYLLPWSERFPALRMVVEHLSTAHAVAFVRDARPGVAATITAHHLLLNRNDLLVGGIRPHAYCLPVAKRESDRLALLEAATSGDSRFFLGTDSAPHARPDKESACGCAGIYTAHAALELYAEAFSGADAIERLPAFACEYGARFYRLPDSPAQQAAAELELVQKPWRVADSLPYCDGDLVPFRAGAEIGWQLQSADQTP